MKEPDEDFSFLTPNFFAKASAYPGSVGTFRYRYERTGKRDDGSLQVWVYENTSFELARDIETETFPWTEEGVAALRRWLQEKLRERGTEPYRIPYPSKPSRTEEAPKNGG